MKRSDRLAQRRKNIALYAWTEKKQELRRLAVQERREARHHSGFHVGAAGLILAGHSGPQVSSGANVQPHKGGGIKMCAEEPVITRAYQLRGVVAGIVVVAPPKIDDFSKLGLDVTISCGHCRKKFLDEVRRHDGVIKSWTMLLFVNVQTGQQLEMSVGELLNLCGDWNSLREGVAA